MESFDYFESGYVYLNLQNYYNKTINEIAEDIKNGLFCCDKERGD